MPFPLADSAAVADHSDVYVFGGLRLIKGEISPMTMILKLSQKGWFKIGDLQRARSGLSGNNELSSEI